MAEVEKTIPSSCGQYRADIARRPGGGFQMTIFQWTEEWVPGYGKVAEFWERVSRMVTVADTVERAESLAAEEFRSLGTSPAALGGEADAESGATADGGA